MSEVRERQYQICKNCIMDTTDPEIEFNSEGVCNHCKSYIDRVSTRTFTGKEAEVKLNTLVTQIKNKGKGNEYDCIIGVSGGVDSTYVAYLVKKLGLKPLAIHFDNGWNSELAVKNIENTLNKLQIDLYTFVVNWEEFKDLQISFLKASTPDGEVPTDHAINALLMQEANKRNIKYIINGMNFASESLAVPSWAYGHSDWKYIKDVHSRFGEKKLRNYPHFTFLYLFYITFIKRIKVVSILNYIDYKKAEAMRVLQDELSWVYYGGKHYESVYTRFFQSYILPKKFNIDKRRGHLSDLILSGQITRTEALEELNKEIIAPGMAREDKAFVIKKFEMTENELDNIMKQEVKSFRDYKNNFDRIKKLKKFVNYLRGKGYYSK